jgi:hypothetical protein
MVGGSAYMGKKAGENMVNGNEYSEGSADRATRALNERSEFQSRYDPTVPKDQIDHYGQLGKMAKENMLGDRPSHEALKGAIDKKQAELDNQSLGSKFADRFTSLIGRDDPVKMRDRNKEALNGAREELHLYDKNNKYKFGLDNKPELGSTGLPQEKPSLAYKKPDIKSPDFKLDSPIPKGKENLDFNMQNALSSAKQHSDALKDSQVSMAAQASKEANAEQKEDKLAKTKQNLKDQVGPVKDDGKDAPDKLQIAKNKPKDAAKGGQVIS